MASLYELLMSLSLRDEAAASPESSELGSDCVMENAGAETAIPVRHDIEEHDEVIDVARTPPSLLELKTATLHRSPACDFRWHPASLDRYGPELPRVLSNRLTTVLSSPAQFVCPVIRVLSLPCSDADRRVAVRLCCSRSCRWTCSNSCIASSGGSRSGMASLRSDPRTSGYSRGWRG